MRYRLSTLFALVAIAAVFAWCLCPATSDQYPATSTLRPVPSGLQVAAELLEADESYVRSIRLTRPMRVRSARGVSLDL